MYSSLMFPDSITSLMFQLNNFHDHALVILTMITSLVIYWFWSILTSSISDRHLMENQTVEVVWTILPMIILIFIALPSLRLLYLLDEVHTPDFSIKIVGSQWYWSYEYSDFPEASFESHMITEPSFLPRLLEVDNRLTLPMNTPLRMVVTASDVIHSWTVPVLGLKADAIPGRLNQLSAKMPSPGIFYGQCSEICGAHHSFMPIVVESVSMSHFLNFLS